MKARVLFTNTIVAKLEQIVEADKLVFVDG
jgi:hypothetical protein